MGTLLTARGMHDDGRGPLGQWVVRGVRGTWIFRPVQPLAMPPKTACN
jgi:hypothetical protein